MIYRLALVLLASLSLCAPRSTAADSTSFFRVEKTDGVWWLRSPDGQPFLSLGVCVTNRTPDRIRGTNTSPYEEHFKRAGTTPKQWREATAKRFADWGFNTLGAWSSPKLATETHAGRRLASASMVDLGLEFVSIQGGGHAWMQGKFPDVFDPAFASFAAARALEKCTPNRDNLWLIGWFLDNELKWGPDWRGPDELLTDFMNAPVTSPGRKAAFDLLQARYPEIASFNTIWKTTFASWTEARSALQIVPPFRNKGVALQNQNTDRTGSAAFLADCDAFLTLVAERYFATTTSAIRAADPNHLILGCRFPIVVPPLVRTITARHCDVISINSYASNPADDIHAYDETDRPILIGEYTFRGADAGLPNSNKGLPIVPTQRDRAAATEAYLRAAFAHPSVIGAHWFQYVDQPKEGRFDGENSNVGLVTIEDHPYAPLVEMFARVNRALPVIHGAAKPLHEP